MTLGSRLKKARQIKRLTQVELGKTLGSSDATINRYEKDVRKPDPDTLNKLATILGVSIDWLMGRKNSKDTNIIQFSQKKQFDLVDILENKEIEITAAGKPLTQKTINKVLKVIDESIENKDEDDIDITRLRMNASIEGDERSFTMDKDIEQIIKSALKLAEKQTKIWEEEDAKD